MLTVREAAEAVSSGRTGKSDAPSKKRIATTWRSLRNRLHLVQVAVTVHVSEWKLKLLQKSHEA